MKLMAEVLAQAQEKNYDTTIMAKKLRAMLQSAEENARMLKKQSIFLSQLTAKTIPKGLHCFFMRLTVEYHMLPLDQRDFPHQERLEDPSLYHYALFSDNILAASVVINSVVSNAKVEKAPLESYADIGGLDAQIQEIEAVELPLTHPKLYEDIGIKPPKGVILYEEARIGKTLLTKAMANSTSATFLRVVGSELIQKKEMEEREGTYKCCFEAGNATLA
ncbi:unnamed protein product [Sphagnum troendelagicum]|uniref:ATPase AAA-type core domain-containing protein n=1 Tax=Sphagnum troendelagicum TaxID=128251 RepID=A0ABP0U9W2_9BRYO